MYLANSLSVIVYQLQLQSKELWRVDGGQRWKRVFRYLVFGSFGPLEVEKLQTAIVLQLVESITIQHRQKSGSKNIPDLILKQVLIKHTAKPVSIIIVGCGDMEIEVIEEDRDLWIQFSD